MTRKMRMLLSAVALVAVVAMAWMFLISPLRADIASANSSIAEEQTRLSSAQTKLAAAQTTRAEGQKNEARLIELAKMVPEANQVPSLLVQIQDLADQSGINFLSMSPGGPTESSGFQIIPLQLQFTGTYFDLSDFAYRVEQLVAGPGRLLAVKSIQLKMGGTGTSGTTETSGTTATSADVPGGDSPSLTVSMTLYAFCMDQTGQSTKAAGSNPATSSTAGTSTSN